MRSKKREEKMKKMFGKPLAASEDYAEVLDLFRLHIESFDHFVTHGLETLLDKIKPVEIVDASTATKLANAFPSRMTIAMLLESVAAKGCSLHGKYVDAMPFASSSKVREETQPKSKTLVDELGEMLKVKGFNYHGLEVLYSGVYGTELACEIFIGPVYYQRLRHTVSDKYQICSTGTVDQITRQPIKGRKRGGGIRFGEMERDSMLEHGAAYLLHDRLPTCSDYPIADVCSICGSILTTSFTRPEKRVGRVVKGLLSIRAPKVICRACNTSKGMETVAMPYVFKYLAAELAAMNIKLTLRLSNAAGA